MTPEEKVDELLSKFVNISLSHVDSLVDGIMVALAIKSALISVDEIIEAIDWHSFDTPNQELYFWEKVKEILNNKL